MSSVSLLEVKPHGHNKQNYVLVIHGGAGTITRQGSTPEQQAAYKAALREALLAGYDVLQSGGEAMDAAVAAVTVMEDCPLFNAGKGAVFNTEGKNELEASLMLSKPPESHPTLPSTRRGIGLSLLTRIRNPSHLARSLYLCPSLAPHAFLSGPTVENLWVSLGGELVDPSYFFTEKRWREHRRALGLPEEPFPVATRLDDPDPTSPPNQLPAGTVGAVALDVRGCIAVVTSTGGRTNKLPGRIGDTPMIGAGFWAEEWAVGRFRRFRDRLTRKRNGHAKNRAVGISGTGDGDYFIRLSTAVTAARRVKDRNESLLRATSYAVEELRRNGGSGGIIALNDAGDVAMPLNCAGMYRGVIKADGVAKTAIFKDDVLG